MPCIRYLRKTRTSPVFSKFAGVRERGNPIEPVRLLEEGGTASAQEISEANQSPRADEARMRTHSRRRGHALAMVVLTAAVGFGGHAEAQQTGLFPQAPIRRQRVPCDQEDLTYKIYKHQYFGYHPTCWRSF